MKFRARVHSTIAEFFKKNQSSHICAYALNWLIKEDPKRFRQVMIRLNWYSRNSSHRNRERIDKVIDKLRERSSVSTS